jgi:hypothetical protein
LEAAFQSKFGTELPDVISERHAMRVVASEIDDSTERIIRCLPESYGVDVNAVRFQFSEAEDGRKLFVRTFAVTPRVVERNVRRTKRTGLTRRVTIEEFLEDLDQSGKAVFEKLRELAQAHAMRIIWREKGFSLNVASDEIPVAVFSCCPSSAKFGQSIYTTLDRDRGVKGRVRSQTRKSGHYGARLRRRGYPGLPGMN